MRKVLANTFRDPVPILFNGTGSSQSEALVALVKCTPFNLNSAVNLLVGAEFNLPTSFEENEYMLISGIFVLMWVVAFFLLQVSPMNISIGQSTGV